MANPYDKARELVIAIKESQEYKDYLAAKEKASENQELVVALNDYQEKQFDIQKKTMMGEEIGPDVMQQMQNLYEILTRDPLAAAYLQAQIRFAMMVNGVYETISEVVKI